MNEAKADQQQHIEHDGFDVCSKTEARNLMIMTGKSDGKPFAIRELALVNCKHLLSATFLRRIKFFDILKAT